MSTFEIVQECGPRACVVHLTGDVDASVVPELRHSLDEALSHGADSIVLDLKEVTYADSSALGLLVWLDHRLRPRSGRLIIAGANPDVARILELSGLVNVAASIAMSTNVSAALEGLELPTEPQCLLWTRELTMPPDVGLLGDYRGRVAHMIEPLAFSDSARFDIKVALGEALANAVRHGTSPTDPHDVMVRVSGYDDRVVIEVDDSGPGFDGAHPGSEDLYAPGGRGIMFMRALMDRVEFERLDGGGTRVRLIKHSIKGVEAH